MLRLLRLLQNSCSKPRFLISKNDKLLFIRCRCFHCHCSCPVVVVVVVVVVVAVAAAVVMHGDEAGVVCKYTVLESILLYN